MMPPVVYLNGEFLSEPDAKVPVSDRSFRYGDAVFETLRVYNGSPFAWDAHWERLQQGAQLLHIRPVPSEGTLRQAAGELIRRNARSQAVLRIHLSRGPGPRSYSPAGALSPICVLTLDPVPEELPDAPLRLITATHRLPAGPQLAACKSASRLLQVLAKMEADSFGAEDALLLNGRNEVAEASGANFFWIERDIVWTPPLGSGALDGITRRAVLSICRSENLSAGEKPLTVAHLKRVDFAFLTSTVSEIRSITSIDRRVLSHHPILSRIRQLYRDRVLSECPVASPAPPSG